MWAAAALSCCCALLLLLHNSAAELQYSMTAPYLLKANYTQKMCIVVVDANASTPLNAYFEHESFANPISIFNEILPAGYTSKCSDVYIPTVEKASIGYVTVEVAGIKERKSLVVNGIRPVCVGETGMPIYQPGQNVTCRILCVDGKFMPYDAQLLLFEVVDPNGNRLMQQKNVDTERPFWTFSYLLTDDAPPGFYTMRAEMSSGKTANMNFEVGKIVLPTFDTTLTVAQSVSLLDESLSISVSAKYTYGQPVVAAVRLSICRKPSYWQNEDTCNMDKAGICEYMTQNLGPDGTMSATVDLQKFQLASNGLDMNLITEAVITENQTDVQVTKNANTWVSRQMPTPYFNYLLTKNYYKRGINATGSLTLRDNNNTPMFNRTIMLNVKGETVATCVTDQDGNCPYSFDTSSYTDANLIVEAIFSERAQCYEPTNRWYGSSNPQQYLTRYYSPSGCFVQMSPIVGQPNCGQTISIQVDYSLNLKEVVSNGDAKTAYFTYLILGRSEIKLQGEVVAPLDSTGKGSFSFSFTVTSEIAPTAAVLVTLLLSNGELVADKMNFQVERCFDNQVNLEFSTDKARPGTLVNLNVNAAPNSYCFVRARDQSINILSGGQGQSIGDNVYNNMPYLQIWGPYVEGFDLKEPDPSCINPPDIMEGGLPYEVKDVSSDQSVAADLENFGIRLICSKDNRKPIVCPKPKPCPESTVNPVPFSNDIRTKYGGSSGGSSFATAEAAVVATVRQNFPTSWIEMAAKTDSDGKADISSILPDTITAWETGAFCISAVKGFGVSNGSVYITSFQPFFVEPNMPVSIVHGEECTLKVTAYNYMNQCTPIDVNLADSNQYSASLVSIENENCVCENERTTHTWLLTGRSLGKININVTAETKSNNNCPGNQGGIIYRDTVIRPLEVQPEGIPQEETKSSLICTKASQVTQPFDVRLPENLVNGSARAFVRCIGDPIGLSVRNLRNLAQMPEGCGEHTVALMESNLAVYHYLKSTGSLDKALESEILTNLNNGYVRMLSFISSSGCACTWRRSYVADDSYCNLWLTFRTYSILVGVQTIGVYIDEKLPSQIEIYIMSKQDRPSGGFFTDGRSYADFVNTNCSYTAFAALQLMKAGNNVTHPGVRDAFYYLDNVCKTSNDTIDQALACNAYAKARNREQQKVFLDMLMDKAVVDEGGLYLKPCGARISPFFHSFQRPACSADNIGTSLLLSCLTDQDELSDDNLSRAATIGKWLGGQMNGNGGFSSTMDTPIAIEAMAKYQALTYTKNAANTVTIKSGDTQVHQFTLNSDNSMVLQRADLPQIPAPYQWEVNGQGCVLIQVTTRYNIKPETMESSFDLKVWTSPATCENGDVANFDITCNASYIGKKDSSNMAIMDVKLPSGHRAIESSLSALMEKGIVQQYDLTIQGHVVLYYNNILKNNITSATLSCERTTKVANLKPASVVMYSYYDKDEVAVAPYTHPCSQPLIADCLTSEHLNGKT